MGGSKFHYKIIYIIGENMYLVTSQKSKKTVQVYTVHRTPKLNTFVKVYKVMEQ